MNFVTDIIVPFASAFLGGGFSIYLYRKGVKDKNDADKKIETQNNKRKEDFFRYAIGTISFFTRKQIQEIDNLIENINSSGDCNLQLSIVSELELSELKEIPIKDLFEIFVVNSGGDSTKKSIHFTNLKNCLFNINRIVKKEEETNQTYKVELNKITEKWNSNMSSLNQEYDVLTGSILKTSEIEILTQLKLIMIDEQPKVKKDIISNQKNIIEPIRKILSQSKELSIFSNFIKLTTNSNSLYYLYLGIYDQRQKNLKIISENLQLLNSTINNSLKELK